jgi:hypothetical protein
MGAHAEVGRVLPPARYCFTASYTLMNITALPMISVGPLGIATPKNAEHVKMATKNFLTGNAS